MPEPAAYATAVAVAVSFLAAGAVAVRVRPRNPVGSLLIGVAVLWSIDKLVPAAPTMVRTVLAGGWAAVVAHLVVAFPTGRLRSAVPRLVIGLAYASVATVGLLRLTGSAPNQAVRVLMTLLTTLTGLAVLGLQLLRWRRSTLAQRHLLGPVLSIALVATVAFIVLKPAVIAGVAVRPLLPVLHLAMAAIPLAYLTSLLQRRFDRGAVAELVVHLRDAAPPVGIQPALAKALHDPSLRIGYWVAESESYVDLDGEQIRQPDGADRAATRIDRDGDPLALLVHDPALLDAPDLVEATCAAAALALTNERLTAELRVRLHQLAESRRQVVRTADTERRRLARDLHDGIQQRLLAIPITLGLAEATLTDGSDRARALIGEAKSSTLALLDELRAVAQGIHPPMLTERGLAGAVRELAALAPVPLRLTLDCAAPLPAEVETTAYFVVAEALANVTKHANAQRAEVRIVHGIGRLTVEVRDDGRGGADPARGTGLCGLGERVAATDGTLKVHSPAGGGTRIRAELPCE
ncbi:histidine kinase [Micromonospora pisi]|uniref:histidine kinase n=1 Tax=Micromonospora pisi TaxID=589240 RepID=A0A495JR27_9ACTN|nr:histidine kinase [Micromonospora pisi]RKR91423.1 histidine kinase [Micromonospora pisi]